MSNILAIDSSSRHLTVYAKKGERETLKFIPDCAMRHSEVLMDVIDGALNEIELTPAECDDFLVVTGPGSFTGIRIGISAAKGFASATGKRLLGVTAFELIAYNASKSNFCAVIDAGRGKFYIAECKDGVFCEPKYFGAESFSGQPVFGYEELEIENYTRVDIALSLKKAALDLDNLKGAAEALYVRKSQAEENLKI